MSELPALSVIVVISSDTISPRADVSHLKGCLDALSRQQDPPATEIIVPHHPDVDGIEELSTRFPAVVFVPVPGTSIANRVGGGREHHDVLRAHGLNIATGEVIALLEDYARPDPDWSATIVAAHRRQWAAVGGAIENGIDRPLNWAVYFCDFGKYQNPLPARADAVRVRHQHLLQTCGAGGDSAALERLLSRDRRQWRFDQPWRRAGARPRDRHPSLSGRSWAVLRLARTVHLGPLLCGHTQHGHRRCQALPVCGALSWLACPSSCPNGAHRLDPGPSLPCLPSCPAKSPATGYLLECGRDDRLPCTSAAAWVRVTSKPLHICIDATSWANDRGFGRFTREIVKALLARDEGFRYTLLFDQLPEEPLPPGAEILTARTNSGLNQSAVGSSARSPAYSLKMARLATSVPYDVFFFPTLYSYFPLLQRKPCVVCYHDATAERFPELLFPTKMKSLAVAREDDAGPFPVHSRDDRLRDVRGRSRVDSQVSASAHRCGDRGRRRRLPGH